MKLLSETYALQKIKKEELENLEKREEAEKEERKRTAEEITKFQEHVRNYTPFIHFVVLNSPISFYNIIC